MNANNISLFVFIAAILTTFIFFIKQFIEYKNYSRNKYDNLIDSFATSAYQYAIAIKQTKTTREKSMKTKIEALTGIGTKARKITTEIGGNYAICVSTEAATKKKFLCVYESSNGLSFAKGAVHSRKLVKAFPYTSEETYVDAYKSALKYIGVLEDKVAI